jgi:hypothetical protein
MKHLLLIIGAALVLVGCSHQDQTRSLKVIKAPIVDHPGSYVEVPLPKGYQPVFHFHSTADPTAAIRSLGVCSAVISISSAQITRATTIARALHRVKAQRIEQLGSRTIYRLDEGDTSTTYDITDGLGGDYQAFYSLSGLLLTGSSATLADRAVCPAPLAQTRFRALEQAVQTLAQATVLENSATTSG